MKIQRIASCLLFWLISWTLFAQQDYNTFYREMNPSQDSLSVEENLELLHSFLDNAMAQQDTVRIIHGCMYLANVTYRKGDFTTTHDHLLAAEQLAKLQHNNLLLGRIYHKKAAIYAELEDNDRAIKYYEVAKEQNLKARDNQYLGITYEQLGAMYGYIDSFTIANDYYQKAVLIIEKYNSERSLAVTFANYGNVLAYQDSTEAAMQYYQKALVLNEKLGDEYQMVPCLQNLGGEYAKLGHYDEAFSFYYRALDLSKKNDWMSFLVNSYYHLAGIHEDVEQLDSAVYYHHAYESLRDSVFGPEVQTTIVQSEADQVLAEKENLLMNQESRTRHILWFSIIFSLLLGTGLLLLFRQNRKNSRELAANRKRLLTLTQTLQTKNAPLLDVQQVTEQTDHTTEKTPNPSVFDPYDTRILKTEDWDNFKLLFEKSYPGYLHRLREAYPDLSEAEERLFLLLKLNLTTREAANTLGIKQESVKKTRTRLRKRLQLSSSDSLSEFINNF